MVRVRAYAACVGLTLGSMLFPHPGAAQDAQSVGAWSLHVRATLSGSSYESAPVGYKLYSGATIEAGVRRAVGDQFALELSLRGESREMSGPPDASAAIGSLEVLPISLLAQWRPRVASGLTFQPYLGAGVSFTAAWEKSGALDSVDLGAQLDPMIQAGTDLAINERVAVNLDARLQTLRLRIDDYAAPAPKLKVDPLVLGLGVRVTP